MKANRETPPRRGSDRARQRDSAAGKASESTAARRVRSRSGKPSAPRREPSASRSGPQTNPMPRPTERPGRPKTASQAKARAKARRAKAPKVVRPPLRDRLLHRLTSIDLRPRTLASKVPFVVLIIGSLGVGLGVTLWLSTDAAERSYQLGNARVRNEILQQQKEALERDVLEAQAAPALAEAARKLGMIPTRDTAHLVQDPSGNWVVVGTPKPAQGVPPPPLNTRLPEERPTGQKPPPNPVEAPVRELPGQPPIPVPGGPEVLVRSGDGAATLGTEHLPASAGPSVPGAPQPPAPGPAPIAEPLSAPAPVMPPAPMAAPPVAAEPPVAVEPPVVAPTPPAAPVPPTAPVPPAAVEPPVVAPVPPGAPGPPVVAALPAAPPPPVLPPLNSEQFGPVTVTAPGAAR